MSNNSSKNLLTANELRFHKRCQWHPSKGSWKKSERKLTGQETEPWDVVNGTAPDRLPRAFKYRENNRRLRPCNTELPRITNLGSISCARAQ